MENYEICPYPVRNEGETTVQPLWNEEDHPLKRLSVCESKRDGGPEAPNAANGTAIEGNGNEEE